MPLADLIDRLAPHGWHQLAEGADMDRSVYVFAGGGPDLTDLVRIEGVRCAATLAHPTFGLFVGGWEGEWLEQIRPQLTGLVIVFDEPFPIPDYPPSWPTRIVHREPSAVAYHAFDFAEALPVSPFLEEATLLAARTVLCLYGAERREDIQAMANDPIFVTAYAYDSEEALV